MSTIDKEALITIRELIEQDCFDEAGPFAALEKLCLKNGYAEWSTFREQIEISSTGNEEAILDLTWGALTSTALNYLVEGTCFPSNFRKVEKKLNALRCEKCAGEGGHQSPGIAFLTPCKECCGTGWSDAVEKRNLIEVGGSLLSTPVL